MTIGLISNIAKTEIKKIIQKKIEEEKETAYIISVYPLSENEIQEVKKKVSFLKNKKIKNLIKKEILGGLIIKLGSKEIDFSLAGKLKMIKKLLVS